MLSVSVVSPPSARSLAGARRNFRDEFDGPLNTTNWNDVEENAKDYAKCQAGFRKGASDPSSKWWIAHCTRSGMSEAKQVSTEAGALVIRADAVRVHGSASFANNITGGVTTKRSFGGSNAHGAARPTRICLDAILPGGGSGGGIGQGF